MSDVFSIFNAGHANWRAQKDFETTEVADYDNGGWGPKPHDLETGTIDLSRAQSAGEPAPDAERRSGGVGDRGSRRRG